MKLSDLVRKFNKEKLGSAFEEVPIPANSVVETGVSQDGGLTSLLCDLQETAGEPEPQRHFTAKEDARHRFLFRAGMTGLAGVALLTLMAGNMSENYLLSSSSAIPLATMFKYIKDERTRRIDPEKYNNSGLFSRAMIAVLSLASAAVFVNTTFYMKDKLRPSGSADEPAKTVIVASETDRDIRPYDIDYDKLIEEARKKDDFERFTELLKEHSDVRSKKRKIMNAIGNSLDSRSIDEQYPAEYSVGSNVMTIKKKVLGTRRMYLETGYPAVSAGDTISIGITPSAELKGNFKDHNIDFDITEFLPRLNELNTRVYIEGWEDSIIDFLPGNLETHIEFKIPEDMEPGIYRLVIETYGTDFEKFRYINPVKREVTPLFVGSRSSANPVFITGFGSTIHGDLELELETDFNDDASEKSVPEDEDFWAVLSIPGLSATYYTRPYCCGDYEHVRLFGAFKKHALDIFKLSESSEIHQAFQALVQLDIMDEKGERVSRAQRDFFISYDKNLKYYRLINRTDAVPVKPEIERHVTTRLFPGRDYLIIQAKDVDTKDNHIFADLMQGQHYPIGIEGETYELRWDHKKGFVFDGEKLDIDPRKDRMNTSVNLDGKDIEISCEVIKRLPGDNDLERNLEENGVTLYLKYAK
jgi:hypothetical protein